MTDLPARYRCRHGHLLMGCPDEECPEQNDFLAQVVEDTQRYHDRMIDDAHQVVRDLLRELQ